jgi:hypothetical protein
MSAKLVYQAVKITASTIIGVSSIVDSCQPENKCDAEKQPEKNWDEYEQEKSLQSDGLYKC